MCDVSKLRVGDVVHVRVTVSDSTNPLCVVDTYGCSYSRSDIVHVEPRPLKVGDTATFYGRLFTVIAVHKDLAWIEDIHGGGCITEKLAHLERAE